jgi:hypothetical protein
MDAALAKMLGGACFEDRTAIALRTLATNGAEIPEDRR